MGTISVQEIQQDPDGFLQRIVAGEDMVVVQGTQPLAEVRSVSARTHGPRPYGLRKGHFTVPTDFDQPLQGSRSPR